MNIYFKFVIHLIVLLISALAILLFCPGFYEIHKSPEKLTTSEECPEILTG